MAKSKWPTYHLNYVDEVAGIYYAADLIISDITLDGLRSENKEAREFSERWLLIDFERAVYASHDEVWKRTHMNLSLDFNKLSRPQPIQRS